VTNDVALTQQIRLLRNYGKPEPWVTQCIQFGMNWRLNELAAVVGLAQLKRLDQTIGARNRVAEVYTNALSSLPGLGAVLPTGRSSWYKYIVSLPPEVDRDRFRDHLMSLGIQVPGGVYDVPLHRQPAFVAEWTKNEFPGADAFSSSHVCLPLYFGMPQEDVQYVVESFAETWSRFVKC